MVLRNITRIIFWIMVGMLVASLAPARVAYAVTMEVSCDVRSLIEAIKTANRSPGPDTLELTGGCAYTLNAIDNTGANGANGLPLITSEINLSGNGAVIERDAIDSTPLFRLLQVSSTGVLALNNVTLRNGKLGGAAMACPANCGGGVFNAGTTGVTNSTFTGNTAAGGGGIFNAGTLTVANSTFAGNNALTGGALLNGGAATVRVIHATIAGNNAERDGGGVANQTNGAAILRNTLIAGNKNGNCAGVIVNDGYNFDSGATCRFGSSNNSLSNRDPVLGVLTDNGGFTQTILFGENSPALNRIPGMNGCGVAIATDQRGGARPKPNGVYCDIGAIEVPEADTLLLLGSGIGGVGLWLRWRWRQRVK